MIFIKKKWIKYYLIIKDRFFTLKGLFVLFIIIIIQLIAQLTNDTLIDFLMVFYSITKDS